METSFDVRIYAVSPYRGARGTTYTVRWRVQGLRFRRTFTTRKLADGFRAKLQVATQAGQAFVVGNGLPMSMQEPAPQRTWLEHAMAYVDTKWPHASPRHRRGIAEALTDVTIATIPDLTGAPPVARMRHVLFRGAFNSVRTLGSPGRGGRGRARLAAATLAATGGLQHLRDPAPGPGPDRAAPGRTTGRSVDRRPQASHAAQRAGVRGRARDVREQPAAPGALAGAADHRGRRSAGRGQPRPGPRPARRRADRLPRAGRRTSPACTTPASARPRPWSCAARTASSPRPGGGSCCCRDPTSAPAPHGPTRSTTGEVRGLKHRGREDTRPVPAHPELVGTLRRHLDHFPTGVGGPPVRGPHRPRRRPPRPARTPPWSARRPSTGSGQRPADGAHPATGRLGAGPPALRPASRLPVHLAQRRRPTGPGGRVGRPRRRRPAPRLRQLRRRRRRDRPETHRRSTRPTRQSDGPQGDIAATPDERRAPARAGPVTLPARQRLRPAKLPPYSARTAEITDSGRHQPDTQKGP